VAFPRIRTYDSSRTPRRGEQSAVPHTLAQVDLSAITVTLVAVAEADTAKGGAPETAASDSSHGWLAAMTRQLREQEQALAAAQARVAELETEASAPRARLAQIAALAAGIPAAPALPPARQPEQVAALSHYPSSSRASAAAFHSDAKRQHAAAAGGVAEADSQVARDLGARSVRDIAAPGSPFTWKGRGRQGSIGAAGGRPTGGSDDVLHPAARKLLAALARHAPARFTWGQAATLAGLKPSGGHYNAGRKQLRDLGLVEEGADGLVTPSPAGLDVAGEVPLAPSSP
jgi:hypothetical protein